MIGCVCIPLFILIVFLFPILHLLKPDSKTFKIVSFLLVTIIHLVALWGFLSVRRPPSVYIESEESFTCFYFVLLLVISYLLVLILLIASIKRKSKGAIVFTIVLLLLQPAGHLLSDFVPGTYYYVERRIRKQLEENDIGKQKALQIALQGRDPAEFEIISYREAQVLADEDGSLDLSLVEGSLVYSFEIVSKKDREKRKKYGKIGKRQYDRRSSPKVFKSYDYPSDIRPRSEYIGKYLHVDVNGETGEVERCEFVYDTDVENPVSEDPDYPPCK